MTTALIDDQGAIKISYNFHIYRDVPISLYDGQT